jgi:hypothetical protein
MAIDMTGQTYGRVTVLARHGLLGKKATWLCRCECSSEFTVEGRSLRSGNTKSCGCLKAETLSNRRTHGQSRRGTNGGKTRTYRCWENMKTRCHNPKAPSFEYYGLIGIGVCPRWDASFDAFLEDMGEAPEGLSIDRIDPWDDYRRDNCRWATALEQSNNQRRHHQRPSSEPATST